MKKSNKWRTQRGTITDHEKIFDAIGALTDDDSVDEYDDVPFDPDPPERVVIRIKPRAPLFGEKRGKNAGKRDTRPHADYNPAKVRDMLDRIIEHVRKGSFGKASNERSSYLINQVVEAFLEMDPELPNFKAVEDTIKKLLVVARSFDEYGGKAFISDEVYDKVVARWRELGNDEPYPIVPDGKGKRMKVDIKHGKLHNNMDKVYRVWSSDRVPDGVAENGSLEGFLKSAFKACDISKNTVIRVAIKPKVDGVSVNADVVGEKLVDPQTRGDASSSMLIRGLSGLRVGKGVNDGRTPAIQFEAFCADNDRIDVSEYLKLPTPYVSCRHAAQGIIQRLCSGPDDGLLDFINLFPIEADGIDDMNYLERQEYIANYAIVPNDFDLLEGTTIQGNLDSILGKVERVFALFKERRPKLSYPIDGIVLTIADDKYQKILGRDGRTNKYQIALKFDPSGGQSKVTGVHLDCSKKGYRSVQVDVDPPVYVDGVRYTFGTPRTYEEFKSMGLRKGSVITIRRVGDAIPSMTVDEVGRGKPIKVPTHCPECMEPLVIMNKKLYCQNPQCPANLSGRIQTFVEALGLDGYGEEFAGQIVEKFGPDAKGSPVTVRHMADLLSITPDGFRAVGMKGKIPEKFPRLLKDAIRKTPDYVILGGLGIPGVAAISAKAILKEYKGWEEFVNALDSITLDDHLKAALGEKNGTKVFRALRIQNGHENYISDIQEIGHFMANFTETFEKARVRIGHSGLGKFMPGDIASICVANGWDTVNNMDFTLLVVADKDVRTRKTERAIKADIPVYTVDEFKEEFGDGKEE